MTSKSNANAHAETKPAPAIIVFGLDQDSKPKRLYSLRSKRGLPPKPPN